MTFKIHFLLNWNSPQDSLHHIAHSYLFSGNLLYVKNVLYFDLLHMLDGNSKYANRVKKDPIIHIDNEYITGRLEDTYKHM